MVLWICDIKSVAQHSYAALVLSATFCSSIFCVCLFLGISVLVFRNQTLLSFLRFTGLSELISLLSFLCISFHQILYFFRVLCIQLFLYLFIYFRVVVSLFLRTCGFTTLICVYLCLFIWFRRRRKMNLTLGLFLC